MINIASRSINPTRAATVMATLRACAAVALAWGAVQPTSAAGGAERFRAFDGAPVKLDVSRLLSRRVEVPMKVVVVMSETSIAEARAATVDHKITDLERDAITQRVRSQHAWVRPHLDGQGARVLREFHGALNGVKIEVKPSRIAAIAALPGVLRVLPVALHRRNNVDSVPAIDAPAVWQALPGYRGEGIKVAIIDTGIDYTHANFGGPGTVAAYTAASATSTLPANPALFGPAAPKVKGGIDLVGDAYDANVATSVPVPDSNPLDCEGHGSHVAGTVAGYGVTSAGTTYAGPYNSAAYTAGAFSIGPGIAPKADLYAVRVFGCTGSTDVVVEAIDWAINNGMDVINMSLGSNFGAADTADALAATNAARSGVVVVASAGNAGPAPYIAGTPSSGDGVISVAAIDSRRSFPGATLTLAGGQKINAQNSNGAPLPGGGLPVVVLRKADGTVSLGCDLAEYTAAGVAGKLVVTTRGSCARTDRAVNGQKAGAAAVALINNAAGYPVYEGPIAGVSIPFFGIAPGDAAALTAATAVTSFTALTLDNPNEGLAASFTSGGPRVGDSALRPSVSAPGVSIFSTASGTGNGSIAESGTSMAAPHVAGVAALVSQAHPRWRERALAAAVVETASPSRLHDYSARLEGSGLVQPLPATLTNAVVFVEGDPLATAVSFGFEEFTRDFAASRTLRVANRGRAPILFNVTTTPGVGSPHKTQLNHPAVLVRGGDDAEVKLSLYVPAATVGDSSDFREVGGVVTFTPADPSMNNGVTLRVPYYLVPRARALLNADLRGDFGPKSPSAVVRLSNRAPAATANADFYALGLIGSRQGVAPFDVRAVGAQSFPSDNLLVFAINTFERFNNPAAGEFDIAIDTDGDGIADYVVFAADYGAVTAGDASGETGVFVLNPKTGDIVIGYFAAAPTDGSTLLLPVKISDLGLTAAKGQFSYQVTFFNADGGSGAVPGTASFDAFKPAISNGNYVTLAPGQSASEPVQIDRVQWLKTPARGLMVVDLENNSGPDQAILLRVGGR